MPLLEYRCGDCATDTEHLVLAGDVASTPVCPKCGSQQMNRMLSTFAARSHGGGSKSDFDAATACGGGPCQMPEACGRGDDAGGDGYDF